MEAVGLVGVGAMGRALLERLRLAGTMPTAYDVAPAACEAAQALGATVVDSPARVAEASTLVGVVVDDDRQVLDTTLGPNGVLAGARPDTLLLLHSTIHPRTTWTVAEAARARDVAVVDACMAGVPRAVRAGEVDFLVGGEAAAVERARPHLLRLGRQVLHLGPLGAGNVAELVKNLVSGSERLVIHEAISIAQAAGLPYPRALDMLRQVYTGSVLERWEEIFDPSGANPRPRISPNIADKDLALAVELAHEHGVDVPIAEQLAARAYALGHGNRVDDVPAPGHR